jgi:nicotinamide-nucleotide amidase
MFAEIITIGDEILIGQIVDTNSAFIAQELNKIGVSVFQITSVQDDKQHILQAFAEAESNADIVIITGGLGPTKDDITKKTIAHYFQDTLVRSPEVLENIERLWRDYVKQPLQQVNKNQALVPSKATVLMNTFGSAPGMWLEKNDTIFVSLPGVPYEMKALIKNKVLPSLQSKYKLPYITHTTLLTYGIGESMLAERIEVWEDALPSHIKLAYLPNLGKVRLRLSAKGLDKIRVDQEIEKQVSKLLPLIEDVFIGFQNLDESIEQILGAKLLEQHKTLALAESCTGGSMAEHITKHSGVSGFFKGSATCYSTTSKIDILGIEESLINTHSVVSAEVAEAMASAARQIYKSDYAIATTGNAGPTKGDADAEVGTVFISIATPESVYSEEFHFGKPRHRVIQKSVNKAFEMLYKEISKK